MRATWRRRYAFSAVTAVTVLVAALASCTSPGGDTSDDVPSMSDLIQPIRKTSALHWKGTWRAGIGKLDPDTLQPDDADVTADLRALGHGEVFGTITVSGAGAQVLQLDEKHQFIKAGADFWRRMNQSLIPITDLAGQWVAQEDDPQDFGLDLNRLVPAQLATRLSAYTPPSPIPSDPLDDPHSSSTTPDWRAAPSDSPAPRPRPAGVPGDALRFDMDGGVSGLEGEPDGSYWFTARAPHHLLGYSGDGWASDAQLTVTQAGAKDAYADLAAALRSIPATVTTNSIHDGLDVTLPEEVTPCARGACLPVRVPVRVRNDSSTHTIGEKITVTLYGTGDFTSPDAIKDPVGDCSFTVPPLKPGTSLTRMCTFNDQRITRILDGHPYVFFRVDAAGITTKATGPSEAKELAQRLPEQ
ncbi:hypothetical protein ACF1AY_34580 [Streptomyces sp. NPDC014776]|uniref:hypothetical protein n=1 Tax=unclassified Streptomyces TaxID=2593676 RepID=UPI0036FF703E